VAEVACRPLASVLAEHGVPYYLKVDVEGHDFICLRGLARPDLPAHVSFETGGAAAVRHLAGLGYRRFKLVSQTTFLPTHPTPCWAARRHALATRVTGWRGNAARLARRTGLRGWAGQELDARRRDGAWEFPMGSSGPFAERLPGGWLDADAVSRLIVARSAAGDAADLGCWFDVHAAL